MKTIFRETLFVLKSQQSMFTRSHKQSAAATIAPFKITYILAKHLYNEFVSIGQ